MHKQTKGIWQHLKNTRASITPQDEHKAVECIRPRKGTLTACVLGVWGGGGDWWFLLPCLEKDG